jgi:outer membrane protein OmpA-like peptidoglycan-associated protein
MTGPLSSAPARTRPDPIAPPVPDLHDALAIERDADARADRALTGRGLETASPRRLPQTPRGAFRGLGPGRPLPPPLSARLSAALGVDLSGLRLHTGPAAAAQAEAMGARAAIAGRDVLLGDAARDLSRPEALRTLAHEAAHLAQAAANPGLPAVLRDETTAAKGTGIGRTPPKAVYSKGSGLAAEDKAVTFAFDRADLSPSAAAELQALAATWTEPMQIDLYGYASTEGPGGYNLNLSAHRAVAVQRLLRPLLPPGSDIRLHAHGEIAAFDPADDNRRVGIAAKPKAAGAATPAQVPGLPKPAPTPPTAAKSPKAEPPVAADPAAPDPASQPLPGPDADLPPPPPFVPIPHRFRLPLRRPLVLAPVTAQTLFPPPLLRTDPALGLDYLPFASAAALRGLRLNDIAGRGELAEAYTLHRTLYPWIPESADEVDNWLLGKIVGAITAQAATERAFNAHLAREYPGVEENLERFGQIERAMRGEAEPFVIPPITVLEFEFDLSLGVFRKK